MFEKAWAQRAPWLTLMIPLSYMYGALQWLHRKSYEWGILKQTSFNMPVIVVGNIFVGGTGKTPTVIALAQRYTSEGKRVGVVSRGYGARASHYPILVKSGDKVSVAGDEPLLIAESTQATVVCDPHRVRGIQYLIKLGCDLIICDDGLQHYRLKPSTTIALHPAEWSGSSYLLPAGPLREPLSRLKSFDQVIMMDDSKRELYCRDADGCGVDFDQLPQHLQVVVGIAQPERLFRFLDTLSLQYEPHIFPDHYAFTPDDFVNIAGPILMTEKDWVKCRAFCRDGSPPLKIYIVGYRIHLL